MAVVPPAGTATDELKKFWAKFVADVNDSTLPSQSEATDLLRLDATKVSVTQGDAFYVAVATLYNDLGITKQATYLAMRGEIDQAGETASNNLFAILTPVLISKPDIVPVAQDLLRAARQAELDKIPADIAAVKTDRDLKSNQILVDAYNKGIDALNNRANELRGKPGVT